jgi:hypothetical protein
MQEVVRDTRESFGHTYAEPLSGLRVSWGSVLAGAVTTLAVSLILWALAVAIISLATHPDVGSLRGSAVALWVCAMGTTLIGAFVGGWFAGYLPGNPRSTIGAAHGFLAWAVALIITFAFQFTMVRGAAVAATNAIAQSGMLQEAPGGPGGAPGANPGEPSAAPPPSQQQMTNVGHEAINTMVGLSWSWFGTWAVALILAVGAGAAATTRYSGTSFRGTIEEERRERRVGPPLTPAPST